MRSLFGLFVWVFVPTASGLFASNIVSAADDKGGTPIVSPAIEKSDLPCGHKFLYRVARDHAVVHLAREKGITRAAAREKLDHIDDSTVHAAVQAAGLKVKDLPTGDKLEDFLTWVVNHQDLIIAVAKIFITLLALLG